MQTSRVVPAQILPPNEGKHTYRILSNDGRVWYAFPEIAEVMEVNRAYDVEFVERDSKCASYYTIKRIKAIESAQLQRGPAREILGPGLTRIVQTGSEPAV